MPLYKQISKVVVENIPVCPFCGKEEPTKSFHHDDCSEGTILADVADNYERYILKEDEQNRRYIIHMYQEMDGYGYPTILDADEQELDSLAEFLNERIAELNDDLKAAKMALQIIS